jgi:hypothetical protein
MITVTSSIPGGASRALPGTPTRPSGWPIASYDNYLDAQRAVDYLADNAFAVEDVTIVGVDLMLVERVTGRLTWGRVLGTGAASGGWFGLFVGLLLAMLSSQGDLLRPILVALPIGIVFGVVFAAVGYASTRGRRDFQSASQLVAGRYDVLCQPRSAEQARDMVAKLAMKPPPTP